MSPVARHLSTARSGVDCGANCFVQHFGWRDSEREAQRAIAVVRVEPIVGGLENHSCCSEHRFVASPGNLEEDLVLTFQLNFFVVQASGEQHRAIRRHELLRCKSGAGRTRG